MDQELLFVYGLQHIFFFVYGLYMLMKFSPDIARNNEYHFFRALLFVFLFYTAVGGVWSFTEYDVIRMPGWMFWILSICVMGSIITAGVFLYLFVLNRLTPKFGAEKGVLWFGSVLYLIEMTGLISSPLTHWLISVTLENTMVYEPGFVIIPVFTVLSFGVLIVMAVRKMLETRSDTVRRSSITIIISVVLILVCGVADNLFEKISILPIAIFGALYFIFINMQESSINSDQLTRMNNRRKADEYLSEKLLSVSPEAPLFLYALDLNGFKGINDTYGHSEGDEALVLFANTIKRTITAYAGFAARFGGDEFVMAWSPADLNRTVSPEQLSKEMEQQLHEICVQQHKPYVLSCCAGYTTCTDPDIPLQTYLKQADAELYRNKAQYYEHRK